jgi:uncharacterized protein GlcG (DUF336 family)
MASASTGPRSALAAALAGAAALLTACSGPGPSGGGSGTLNRVEVVQGAALPLTALDVSAVVEAAARATVSTPLSIAVVDRVGNVLAVFSRPPPGPTVSEAEELAVGKARTGAFFSNDTAPLSSELIRFLSREHFPEGIINTPSADLFGIENTNRGCPLTGGAGVVTFPFNAAQAIPASTNIPGTGPGRGIVTVPGGFPLFKNNRLVGGVGVFGAGQVVDEFAALTATAGYQLAAAEPGRILLEGITLPYLSTTGSEGRIPPGTIAGDFPAGGGFRLDVPGVAPAPVRGSPIVALPFAPEGYLIGPVAGSSLTVQEVDGIIQAAVGQATRTRAAIRLPPGNKTRMVLAVAEGVGSPTVSRGTLLGLFRMPDATVFSIDVAASKARNVVYFSDPARSPNDLPGVPPGIAVTNRTIGFGAQTAFPSGIDGAGPGPFRMLFNFDTGNPCTQGGDPGNIFPAGNKSGIVFFPGSTSLYKNGVMVGGFGASGDGVAQDDVITEAGGRAFLPPQSIRADTIVINNVRLPYFKFSRSPEN